MGSSFFTNMRTPVIPITEPFFAIFLMASSVLHLGCPGASARTFECVISTGFLDISKASKVV